MSKFQRYLLGDIAEIQTGPFGSQLHEEDYVSIGTPIVTVEHLGETGFIQKNLPLVSDDDKKRLSKYILKEGDIVFSRVGSIDRCTYVSKNEDGWLFSGRCLRVRIGEEANAKFISYYFRQRFFKAMMLNISVGATMPSLNTSLMANIPLSLPDLYAQQKIATVLSSLDAKIELNNRINVELEAMAKTLYDYWFVQFDFPDANGKPYKSSGGKMVWNEELKREIPEGWETKNIGSILAKDIQKEKINSSEYKSIGKYPIIDQSTDFICGFTDNECSVIKSHVPRIIFGDHTRIIKLVNFDFARGADGTQVLLSNSNSMPQHLFYHSLLRIDLSNYGYARHFKFLKGATIVVPTESVANLFESIAIKIYKKIKHNIFENQYLSSLRDWLLPMLMNGQVSDGETENAFYQAKEEERMAAEPAAGLKKDFANPTKQEDFLRKLMLASHIVYELCDEPTFGHTKLMKLLYLSEQIGDMALQTNYKKAAAGPFDGRTLNLIDQEYKKNKWFTLEKRSYTVNDQQREATVYKKTEKSLCYKKHFDNYFGQESDSINKLISLFRNEKTQTAEIVATLYFAWKELLAKKTIISESILIKAFYDFHKEKKKFNKEQILDGYHYMLTNGIHP